jgi:hypothetical protein
LSEMFNHSELDIVRRHGGNMHREHVDDQSDAGTIGQRPQQRPRVLIRESNFDIEDADKPTVRPEGRLSGPYKHVSWTTEAFGEKVADMFLSTSSSARRPPCASSSLRPPSASPGSSNRTSSIALAAARASANLSEAPSQTVRAASQPRSDGSRTPSITSRHRTKKADRAGYTARPCSAHRAR